MNSSYIKSFILKLRNYSYHYWCGLWRQLFMQLVMAAYLSAVDRNRSNMASGNYIDSSYQNIPDLWPDLLKNAVFWGVAPCRCGRLNRRFGGSYRLHLQDRKIRERRTVNYESIVVLCGLEV
jgi:hypothetical protein